MARSRPLSLVSPRPWASLLSFLYHRPYPEVPAWSCTAFQKSVFILLRDHQGEKMPVKTVAISHVSSPGSH